LFLFRLFCDYRYVRLRFSGWRAATADEKGDSVMEMEVFFPGGKKVNSTYKGFTVKTDQAKNEGGDGTAPEPYDLFLASIGTCAGVSSTPRKLN